MWRIPCTELRYECQGVDNLNRHALGDLSGLVADDTSYFMECQYQTKAGSQTVVLT